MHPTCTYFQVKSRLRYKTKHFLYSHKFENFINLLEGKLKRGRKETHKLNIFAKRLFYYSNIRAFDFCRL